MKYTINLITYNNGYGLTRDVQLLAKVIEECKPDNTTVDLKFSDFYSYQLRAADINIFLEIPSKMFFPHAHANVLIPNQEWYYRTWVPYITSFDQVWTKSQYATEMYRNLVKENGGSTAVKYLGWQSNDYSNKQELSDSWVDVSDQEDNNNERWLHVCGKSIYKQTQVVIDSWKPEYPHLDIIYSPKDVKGLIAHKKDNITYHTTRLSDKDLIEKMRTSKIHLCPSETEGFGHYLHEALSTGALIVSTDGPPMNEWITTKEGFLASAKKKRVGEKLGSRYIISVEQMQQVLEKVVSLTPEERVVYYQASRQKYQDLLTSFRNKSTDFLKDIFSLVDSRKKIQPLMPIQKYLSPISTSDLPPVSILTLVHNRKSFFKLAKMNFQSFQYPPEKLEWVIIDDSDQDESVWDLIPPDPRVQYVQKKTKMDLGAKRNESVRLATHDILVVMDDDDYYPPESILKRVTYHLQSGKECVTSTILGCFEINKYISMINVPPHQLAFEDRLSEASLLFTRDFWSRQPFREDSRGSEAKEFLANRSSQCLEVTWTGILVALLHTRNTSTKIVRSDKPNGCHFGWSDKLFLFITSLDDANN